MIDNINNMIELLNIYKAIEEQDKNDITIEEFEQNKNFNRYLRMQLIKFIDELKREI